MGTCTAVEETCVLRIGHTEAREILQPTRLAIQSKLLISTESKDCLPLQTKLNTNE
jgi:hypothetical protein